MIQKMRRMYAPHLFVFINLYNKIKKFSFAGYFNGIGHNQAFSICVKPHRFVSFYFIGRDMVIIQFRETQVVTLICGWKDT